MVCAIPAVAGYSPDATKLFPVRLLPLRCHLAFTQFWSENQARHS
jgi:hypothetical protein